MSDKIRCDWCGTDQIYLDYHDQEWGVPVYDSRALWEKLILDGFQAGLSWITILKRRDTFISAFNGFAPEIIAQYDDDDIERLMNDKGIIRNRMKIIATIKNAKCYLEIEAEKPGAFSEFIWSFTGGVVKKNQLSTMREMPTQSEESEAMSKALKKRGFGFCGPTICYAFMQAVGIINDHLVTCHRYEK
ncbi:MAG: DNA-3-methyladenine glycosylase I [Kordiimonadaceae bacterium]|jgi:DNA-3-methyladenine glycosylase I|nr:DNA-3-methyladenine glycosylase I [Kordiimonadaceae bacterium]MBT6035752.1 DNA-3-methyladenine glycosylase I [Kordiimonadaceae bacterium]MBT6329066.1 DNA-3-methyladenine glycosylase I [Kordiimonadaceae bacterium]MBT7581726.1 DNA-3-methyladenine glycosylase I [Kordiimonadaceae bacterium]